MREVAQAVAAAGATGLLRPVAQLSLRSRGGRYASVGSESAIVDQRMVVDSRNTAGLSIARVVCDADRSVETDDVTRKRANNSAPALMAAVARRIRRPFLSTSIAVLATTAPILPVRAEDLGGLVFSLDAPSLPDLSSFTDLLSANPALAAGGAIALAVPVVLFSVLGGSRYPAVKPLTPSEAYQLLSDDADSVLLDIRGKTVAAEDGSPSLTKLKKKLNTVAFEIEDAGTFVDDPDFATKVASKKGFEEKETVTVIVIDRFGKTGKTAGQALTKEGFAKVLYVNGGAEAWKAEGFPWRTRRSSFTLDMDSIKEAIDSTVKENPNLVPTTLGVAAAAGASVVFLSEVETALQVLGSVALLQLLIRKFLFAKDRKKTLAELSAVLSGRNELVKGVKKFSQAVLTAEPETEEEEMLKQILKGKKRKVKEAVDTVTEKVDTRTVVNGSVVVGAAVAETTEKVLSVIELEPSLGIIDSDKAESEPAVAAPAIEGDAELQGQSPVLGEVVVPTAITANEEASAVTIVSPADNELPRTSRPLSPYPMYSDLKPPTSPTPSKP